MAQVFPFWLTKKVFLKVTKASFKSSSSKASKVWKITKQGKIESSNLFFIWRVGLLSLLDSCISFQSNGNQIHIVIVLCYLCLLHYMCLINKLSLIFLFYLLCIVLLCLLNCLFFKWYLVKVIIFMRLRGAERWGKL